MRSTYEKVNKSIKRLINIVQIVDEDDFDELGFEYSNEEFQNDLAYTRDFIEQHKPPTWEDVVNTWRSIDPNLTIVRWSNAVTVGDNFNTGTHIFSYNFDTKEFEEINISSIEELNATNLTIRYIEAQEAKNQTNAK